MRAAIVIVAALLSVAVAQVNKCQGMNVTMNPGLQPFTTQAGTPSTTLTQACPFGYISDTTQGGRCISYRQAVSNYMDAPCYQDSDCGAAGLTLACGANKKCTWSGTRQLDDPCTDNVNCRSYTALNGSTIQTYCALKTTNKCSVLTVVTVGVNARCNYTVGNERYMCDDATTCKYFNNQNAASQTGTFGAGVCVPLRQSGEVCVETTDVTRYLFPNLWCANKLACFGQFSNNRTCVTPRNQGEVCYQYGLPYECANGLYCDGVAKSCQPYVGVGTNCTGDFLTSTAIGGKCQMGLRCIVTPGLGYRQCATAASAGQLCSQVTTDIVSGNNCTAGLQCIIQPARGINGGTCFAGANGDFCQIYTSGATIDSCQAGLFCQSQVPSNYTCIPKFQVGASCNISNHCLDGLSCVNSTCTAFQNEGQVCQELRPIGGDYGLNYLRCNPSLQCSRGICIQNYTKSVGDFCSQDADCENSHCDAALKRCTRRQLCKTSSGACQCACSSGPDNMGQCIMNTCNKASNALRNCLNPLDFNPFANSSKYIDNYFSPMATEVIYDSGSSYYTKCSGQWSDWMRCRGLMAKWGYPAVPLGDYLLYDLATISASSTVSVSFVAMIAFVLAIALNL